MGLSSRRFRFLGGTRPGRGRLPVLLVLLLTASTLMAASADNIADHLVISEVLASPGDGELPFIELYNPTDSSISFSACYLDSDQGEGSVYLDGQIDGYGFYLVSIPDDAGWPAGWPEPDLTSDLLSFGYPDGGFKLYLNGELIDACGWGSPSSGFYEYTPCASPAAGESLERKSGHTHGEDEGNGHDTEDNFFDFNGRDTPEPQNSDSPHEIPPASTDDTTMGWIKAMFGPDR